MFQTMAKAANDIGVPPIGPEPIVEAATGVGRRGLWVVAILMLLSSLVFYVLAARVAVTKRLFHVLVSLVTTVSFLVYFAMAMGYGSCLAHQGSHKHYKDSPEIPREIFRELYWIRFLNWTLTSPLILICLSLLSGLNGASLLVAVSGNLVLFVAGLASTAINHRGRQWAWFTIACLGYLTVVYQIGYQGRRSTLAKDQQTRRFYSSIAGFSLIVLLVYPIIWAASSNARKMSVDAEIIVYAILDILSQAVFGYWLIVSHDSMQSITLNLDGFWANGLGNEGSIRVGDQEDA
ncbi:hypothetical protein FQN57_002065 [Myotisia sp. PD_48]|nr:hypothetical protein FQN57_002065 [Myotisia sp. PD_48]